MLGNCWTIYIYTHQMCFTENFFSKGKIFQFIPKKIQLQHDLFRQKKIISSEISSTYLRVDINAAQHIIGPIILTFIQNKSKKKLYNLSVRVS